MGFYNCPISGCSGCIEFDTIIILEWWEMSDKKYFNERVCENRRNDRYKKRKYITVNSDTSKCLNI